MTETKLRILTELTIVGIMGWCFIPCLWAIDSEINGTSHFIDGFIFAGVTSIFLVIFLYIANLVIFLYIAKKEIDKPQLVGVKEKKE